VLKMRTLLCLKMLVSDYQLVLRRIADEQNAYKCGWMEISDIIPFTHSRVFILCYFSDYFGYVGLCEYMCLCLMWMCVRRTYSLIY
jgi:hypothetical protein